MDHAAAMRSVQRTRDLHSILQDLVEGQRSLFEPLCQRLPFHALHHKIVDAILTADVMQHTNVRMIQAGNGLSFAFEALLSNGIGGKLLRQYLNRDSPLQPRVARAIDFAHPARAERRRDFIGAKPSARSERHSWP